MANIVPIDAFEFSNYIATNAEPEAKKSGFDPNAIGVYGALPTCTPKYARWRPERHHEFEGTTARLLLQIPSGTLKSLREELDDDVTQMIFNVLASDGVEGGVGYIDFLLTQAVHPIEEKVQISESLSDSFTSFFFGHAPPVFQYAGILMNTYQDDWAMRMLRLFRDLGRGTQLARRGVLLHLRYDSMIVSGAMLNLQWTHLGARETADDFSFNMLVHKLNIIYGGAALPTNIENISTVAPEDFFFTPEGTDLGDIEAIQSYVQGPANGAGPEGVSSTSSQDTIGGL